MMSIFSLIIVVTAHYFQKDYIPVDNRKSFYSVSVTDNRVTAYIFGRQYCLFKNKTYKKNVLFYLYKIKHLWTLITF